MLVVGYTQIWVHSRVGYTRWGVCPVGVHSVGVYPFLGMLREGTLGGDTLSGWAELPIMGQILQDGKKVLEMSSTYLHSKSRPAQTVGPGTFSF